MGLPTPQKLRKLQRKLYRKAKQQPDFRFYSLFDKVCWMETLQHAWWRVRRNGGAPGVDGVTIQQIEEQGAGRWLEELREELRSGGYEAKPVRRVEIPKRGGGKRPLGIPTVKDRVVQTAVKLVIEPIFEADFKDEAHGYRPERSPREAIEKVHKHLIDGRRDVVDADLSSYFDTIPHDSLMESVRRRVSDGTILELIGMWLNVPMIDENDDGTKRIISSNGEGTPQGGIVSPLLANIYFNRFLKYWAKRQLDQKLDAKIVNYADDFVILTRGHAEEALQETRRVMEAMGLKRNERKTKIRNVDRQDLEFLGYQYSWEYYRKGERTYLAAQPSSSSLNQFKDELRPWFKRTMVAPWKGFCEMLNQKLEGWANYYSYGTVTFANRALDNFVGDRVRALLTKRCRVSGRGTERWPNEQLFGRYGITSLRDVQYDRT